MENKQSVLVKKCLRCKDLEYIEEELRKWESMLKLWHDNSAAVIGCGYDEDEIIATVIELRRSRDVASEMSCCCEMQLLLPPLSNTGVS